MPVGNGVAGISKLGSIAWSDFISCSDDMFAVEECVVVVGLGEPRGNALIGEDLELGLPSLLVFLGGVLLAALFVLLSMVMRVK